MRKPIAGGTNRRELAASSANASLYGSLLSTGKSHLSNRSVQDDSRALPSVPRRFRLFDSTCRLNESARPKAIS